MTHQELMGLLKLEGAWFALALLIFTWHTVPARVIRSLPLWLGYSLLALALDVIGLVLIALLSACHAWHWDFSRVYRDDGRPLADADKGRTGRHVTRWRGGWLTWLWGNEEDGVTGPVWWQQRTGVHGAYPMVGMYWHKAWSAYRWSALRNPSNNLRFIPIINPVIAPARIRSWEWTRTKPLHRAQYAGPVLQYAVLTWQGVFSGIRCHILFRGSQYRFWWGWKLKPEDAQGVPPTDMRAPRCGFGTQFKRIG